MLRKWSNFALVLALCGCAQSGIDGTYSADDGEGTRVTVRLDSGRVQFWQADAEAPPLEGRYRVDGDQIVMAIGGRDLFLARDGNCLFPVDDPTQRICRN